MSCIQAIRAALAFKPHGLLWFEEPIEPDAAGIGVEFDWAKLAPHQRA